MRSASKILDKICAKDKWKDMFTGYLPEDIFPKWNHRDRKNYLYSAQSKYVLGQLKILNKKFVEVPQEGIKVQHDHNTTALEIP